MPWCSNMVSTTDNVCDPSISAVLSEVLFIVSNIKFNELLDIDGIAASVAVVLIEFCTGAGFIVMNKLK